VGGLGLLLLQPIGLLHGGNYWGAKKESWPRYGLGYSGVNTVPCWMCVFVVLGARGLENQSLFFFGGRGIWNLYGKKQEGLAAKVAVMVVRGQGFNLWLFYINFSTREFLSHNPKKYTYTLCCPDST